MSSGSSPHLRGNPSPPSTLAGSVGVIPAPTGQPTKDRYSPLPRAGHPRTYGATARQRIVQLMSDGSSPHLRGNLPHPRDSAIRSRVIPAPTGQPPAGHANRQRRWGHPRTYGATRGTMAYNQPPYGSSPHLRGNLSSHVVHHGRAGVIPAPTGQPYRWRQTAHLLSGHPRTYGATASASRATASISGSSPHLRGNRIEVPNSNPSRRVIPAPTGQPCALPQVGRVPSGHPRTYGATLRSFGLGGRGAGSSPHLRGNLSR